MSEVQTFLLQVDEGENTLVFPIPTQMQANRLAALIAANPKIQTISVHRVISSTVNRRQAPKPAEEVAEKVTE